MPAAAFELAPATVGCAELLEVVRCYASYDRQLKQITLFSFPGAVYSITDGLTRERAKYCQLAGNLFDDDDLLEELRRAEQRGLAPDSPPQYGFKAARARTGYSARAEDFKVFATGKNLHQLRANAYEALDVHCATTGGPFFRPQQLRFTLLEVV